MTEKIAAVSNITATGQVKTGPGALVAVSLGAGSDTAQLILYDNTAASGTVIANIQCTTTIRHESWTPSVPYAFSVGIHAALTGTGPNATIVYL